MIALVYEIISRREIRQLHARTAETLRRREFKPRIQQHVRPSRGWDYRQEKRRYEAEIRSNIIHSGALYEVALVMNFKRAPVAPVTRARLKYIRKNAKVSAALRLRRGNPTEYDRFISNNVEMIKVHCLGKDSIAFQSGIFAVRTILVCPSISSAEPIIVEANTFRPNILVSRVFRGYANNPSQFRRYVPAGSLA